MATYTEGIRKLYDPRSHDNLKTTCLNAEKAGYSLALFNGDVWFHDLKDHDNWVQTCLTIEDFQVN